MLWSVAENTARADSTLKSSPSEEMYAVRNHLPIANYQEHQIDPTPFSGPFQSYSVSTIMHTKIEVTRASLQSQH